MAWRIPMGRRWQFAIFHALIRTAGRRCAYVLADLVSLFYVLARPPVRHRCRPYLGRRFPAHAGPRRLLDTWHLVRSFAHLLVDQASARLLEPGEFRSSAAGLEVLTALLGEGKGLIIVTAHVGAWQLGMANLRHLDLPISILAMDESGDPSSPFQGREHCIRIVDPSGFLGGVPELTGALQRGEVACIMGDRALGGAAAITRAAFLEGPVDLPVLPYRLASATGAPIAVLFPFKPRPDTFEMQLGTVLRVPPGLGRDPGAYAPHAAAFARALEAFLQDHPYQFFNFFDLWDSPRTPTIAGQGKT